MITISTIEQAGKTIHSPCVVTLGNFDGIHLGHQALLDRVLQVSQKTGLASCVVTYDPNPAVVLGKKPEMKNLMTFADKEEWIRQKGIDFLVVLSFNKELAEMSAESFLEEILLKQLKAKNIIIGFNHCFGKERRGNYELLKEYSEKLKYSVEKMDPVFLKEIKLSSSYVRRLISEGNVKEAAHCLNRFYSVSGTVVGGHKRGRKIGFPTANVQPTNADILLPGIGVYAGFTTVAGIEYSSMINIGHNPTFGENAITLESNIFDFQKNIYDEGIKIAFAEKIRNEIQFSSVENLIAQLKQDEISARNILKTTIKEKLSRP
ncbi:bifunctional riboflavin kinase/FAD synthetase [Leptospira borgpetersenii]|uniref:bifunctional riboflavin kinase/FAD synthetase n=1 Tax=Leptospira borgpetersenii TaxID=174 RepID=UPI000774DED7|nr:bifunctional riboflavin kinase/FAD synthetase [Leptospira borgpetersenii]MBE8362783.1 bifunctional riboflavin kinase/FAD synthetase [Leptospira borgpetersenii serovar Balcanica]MBE8366569.1 bifunctional riboflavin kinase/FAD synthetase [Leptospira borgpetersenii serovar Balcanica]MBE8399242.1 bifunctional riboflavin kinase/FAD synthetase [Leptospira borgpetersenii serovar Tarassovi]MBE8402134.1 bifunctional riboflavin kinase/FAD synthetase [Leptospira borgpetersenii serovar Tarassovi]MBE840